MAAIFGVLAIVVIIAWFWRNRNVHASINTSAPKTSGGWSRGRGKSRNPLARVDDSGLLATILMLQLVRTGAPVTAAEKSRILALMADPLKIEDREAFYAKAFAYTEQDRSFSAVADDLLPTLRTSLNEAQRKQLIDLLNQVANAYGEASELQLDAIARLEHRLARPAAVSAA